jgi:hypothetical protein
MTTTPTNVAALVNWRAVPDEDRNALIWLAHNCVASEPLSFDVAYMNDCATRVLAMLNRRNDALEALQAERDADKALLDALQAEHERVDPLMALVLKQYYDRDGSEWVGVAGNVRQAITDALAVDAARAASEGTTP